MKTSLTINFGSDEEVTDLRDLLIIEQEEWANTTGQVKMSDFYNFTYNLLTSYTMDNEISCGLNTDGSCTSIIYVFPRIEGLEYSLKTSFGTLSDKVNDDYDHQEIINFDLSTKSDLTYTPSGSISTSWLGSVYDSEGNVTSQPSVSSDAFGNITLSKQIYGSLIVKYKAERHKYTLTVQPRDSGTDLFGAVVYGVFEGGISWLEITNPPDVDELSEGSMSCGGMAISDHSNDPDFFEDPSNAPITAPKVDREIVYDYCSRVVQSDEVIYR